MISSLIFTVVLVIAGSLYYVNQTDSRSKTRGAEVVPSGGTSSNPTNIKENAVNITNPTSELIAEIKEPVKAKSTVTDGVGASNTAVVSANESNASKLTVVVGSSAEEKEKAGAIFKKAIRHVLNERKHKELAKSRAAGDRKEHMDPEAYKATRNMWEEMISKSKINKQPT